MTAFLILSLYFENNNNEYFNNIILKMNDTNLTLYFNHRYGYKSCIVHLFKFKVLETEILKLLYKICCSGNVKNYFINCI